MIIAELPLAASNHNPKLQIFTARDEVAFLAELKSGSSTAFSRLYKNYSAALMGIIIRTVKFEEPAEDVLQETFIKISNNISSFDPGKGRLFTWMARTAKNTAIDHLRTKSERNSRSCEDLQDHVAELEDHYQSSMNIDAIGLKKLTGLLTFKQQQLIDLIYFEGYTHAEAAQKLKIPLGTLKTRIRYAILNLRKFFREM